MNAMGFSFSEEWDKLTTKAGEDFEREKQKKEEEFKAQLARESQKAIDDALGITHQPASLMPSLPSLPPMPVAIKEAVAKYPWLPWAAAAAVVLTVVFVMRKKT